MLGNPAIAAPIVGATKIDHLDDAVARHRYPALGGDRPPIFAKSDAPPSRLQFCWQRFTGARRDHQFLQTLN
jgi:hypothetical protein